MDAECNRPPWEAILFHEEFLQSFSRSYGIRCDGELAGFLVLHVVVDEAHILNFGIRTAFRGRGLGRALLGEVIEILNREGVRRVTLEVRKGNEIARKLYSSFGFIEAGTRERYYRDDNEDAVVMALPLSS